MSETSPGDTNAALPPATCSACLGGSEGRDLLIGLGRLHRWWLREFRSAGERNGDPEIFIEQGFAGTAQGNAIVGLHRRGLVKCLVSFDGGVAGILGLTDLGIMAASALPNKELRDAGFARSGDDVKKILRIN